MKGHFARMVVATGVENAQTLFEIAEKSYRRENRFHEPLKNSQKNDPVSATQNLRKSQLLAGDDALD